MSIATGHKFVCPKCGANSEVIDSRVYADGKMIRRRRGCLKNHRFSTIEVCMESPPETNDLGFASLIHRWANKLMAARLRALADQVEGGRLPGNQVE